LIIVLYSADGNEFDDLFYETYMAKERRLYRLAVMGLRSVLEQLMIAKVGDKGSFNKNLDAFSAAGYISVPQHDQLSTILQTGHAVTHRGYRPTEDDLSSALEVVEGVIESIYVNDYRIRELDEKIPGRL
jgi:hypothetical protein